jgi:hypothetical protein
MIELKLSEEDFERIINALAADRDSCEMASGQEARDEAKELDLLIERLERDRAGQLAPVGK